MRGVTVSDLNDCIITSIIMGIGLVFEIQYDSSQCPQPQYSTKASSFPPASKDLLISQPLNKTHLNYITTWIVFFAGMATIMCHEADDRQHNTSSFGGGSMSSNGWHCSYDTLIQKSYQAESLYEFWRLKCLWEKKTNKLNIHQKCLSVSHR